MVTKTLTITEESYNLLKERKLENESFSQEIKRLLSAKPKKGLMSFFGMLSMEEGQDIISDLQKHKEQEIKELKKRLQHESS